MRIRSVDLCPGQLIQTIGLQRDDYRKFIGQSIYQKPDGISLERANQMLVMFAFTRHPFKKLSSCYYSKFQQRMSYQPMKFAELVIEEISERLDNNRIWKQKITTGNGQYIPQCVLCPYCQLQFDLVGQLEDMETDTAFFARHLGLKVKYLIYYLYFGSISNLPQIT